MAVRLYIYDEKQCDPKKCTGRKLVRFNLAQEISSLRRIPHGAIVLTPWAEKAVSREDAARAAARGNSRITGSHFFTDAILVVHGTVSFVNA